MWKNDEERMCRSREEIIEEYQELQRYQDEIDALKKRVHAGENGETRLDLSMHRSILEGRIDNIMNKDDIAYIRKNQEHHIKYPSILKQLFHIPRMFLALLLATLLAFWMFAGLTPDELRVWINAWGVLHVEDISHINVFIMIVIATLLLYAFNRYRIYVEKETGGKERHA